MLKSLERNCDTRYTNFEKTQNVHKNTVLALCSSGLDDTKSIQKGKGGFMLRNILRYLLLLALVGVLSILYNEYYMTILFFTLAALPFFTFALLQYTYGKVAVNLVLVVHVVKKGEIVPISVQLENPTIFPIANLKLYLNYRNSYSDKQYKKDFLVSIDANTKTSVICNLLSEYAGNLEIALTGVRSYDYLKLFSRKMKKKTVLKVAVLPNYYELLEKQNINHYGSLIESDYYSPVKSGEDPSEVFAIREYREGDRQQRIHWKLSQKLSHLMIKEFSDPLNCSILLFVDLSMPKEINSLLFMDAILECALSLSFSFLLNGQLHYFAWYDREHGSCIRMRIGQEKDLYEAVDGLLQVRPYEPETEVILAYLAEYPKEQYTNIILLTGEQPRRRREALAMLRAITRQIIYIGDIDDQPGTKYFPNEIVKRSEEAAVTLNSVDIRNVKRDLEQLRLE